jgi:hypothetical protein
MLRFTDEEWRDTPALELVKAYLDQLEPLVADAERTFGSDAPEAA